MRNDRITQLHLSIGVGDFTEESGEQIFILNFYTILKFSK